MKKLLFTLVLVLLCSPIYAATKIGDLYYNLDHTNNTAELTYEKYPENPNYQNLVGDVAIPEMVNYNGVAYAVTSIGNFAFRGCSALTSVTIPISVISIGVNSFWNCNGLTNMTIPNSVTSIGGGAFSACSGLTSVTIPNSVTSIEQRAFGYCSALTSVEIPNSVTSIGDYVFSGCSDLTSVTIPNTVTSIGICAFEGCISFTSVEIPNSVITIGAGAFMYCSGLTSVEISDLTDWCNIQFYNDTSNPLYYARHLYLNGTEIKDLVIPNSVNSIGDYAFSGCSDLTSVTIGNSVTSIGEGAFQNCNGLISVTIPNSITEIGDWAFSGCSGLKKVEISDLEAWCKIDFEYFGSNPLYYAQNLYINNELLTELNIPSTITEIKPFAFFGCRNLTSVTIGNSVTSIGDYAFSGCRDLTSVTIGNSVTSIGNYAFYDCFRLTALYIGKNVRTIGSEAFACNNQDEYEEEQLEEVVCASITPPVGDGTVFSNSTYSKATLFVPGNSLESYKEQNPWLNFNSVKTLEESGVEDAIMNSIEALGDIFNLNGQLVMRQASQEDLEALAAGIYIIGGKKVIVK